MNVNQRIWHHFENELLIVRKHSLFDCRVSEWDVMIYLVITVKIMEIQNKVILFYMNKIPPTPHSFLHFLYFLQLSKNAYRIWNNGRI